MFCDQVDDAVEELDGEAGDRYADAKDVLEVEMIFRVNIPVPGDSRAARQTPRMVASD